MFAQLLQVAAQNGVTGTVAVDGAEPRPPRAETAEPPLPPLHAEAFDAIEAGDYQRAVAAYERALAENPRDEDARAGLGQVRLLARVQALDLQAARAAAAADPRDVDAQFAVADLDIAGGHVEDAFVRLLDLFADAADRRARARSRTGCSSCSALIGDADPRVLARAPQPGLAALLSHRPGRSDAAGPLRAPVERRPAQPCVGLGMCASGSWRSQSTPSGGSTSDARGDSFSRSCA